MEAVAKVTAIVQTVSIYVLCAWTARAVQSLTVFLTASSSTIAATAALGFSSFEFGSPDSWVSMGKVEVFPFTAASTNRNDNRTDRWDRNTGKYCGTNNISTSGSSGGDDADATDKSKLERLIENAQVWLAEMSVAADACQSDGS